MLVDGVYCFLLRILLFPILGFSCFSSRNFPSLVLSYSSCVFFSLAKLSIEPQLDNDMEKT